MVLRKLSQTFRIGTALLLSLLSTGIVQVYSAPSAGATAERITICHRTNSVTNPYVVETVDADSVDNNAGNDKGKGDHFVEHKGEVFDADTVYQTPHNGDQWGDIIPAIPGVHAGLNWTTEGKTIYDNGCKTPVTLSVTASACVDPGEATGSITINVHGTSNGTKVVVIRGGETIFASNPINDNTEQPIEVTGLSAGNYIVALKNGSTLSNEQNVTIAECDSDDIKTPVSPVAPQITDLCLAAEDTFTKPANTDQITYSADGNVVTATLVNPDTHEFGALPEGYVVAQDGETATYTVMYKNNDPCVTPKPCTNPANGGVITDKTSGWELLGDAEFVNGAVSINSDNWNDGGVSFTDKYPVAEVQKLNWDLDTNGATGAVGVGILLETENHDVIHYEPGVYTNDFWSNDPVLPANGGGQGGPYSGSLQDLLDTIGNVNIIKTTFVFTSAEANEGVLLTSLSFNCTDYTFDKAPRVPTECSVRPNSFTKEWTYDNATYPDAADYSYVEGETIVNNATYEFNANGLHISTPDTDSSVYGLIDAGSTPIQDVDKMSYDTYRKAISEGYASTQPAYILVVDTNGAEADGEAYFFYEPYNNSSAANTENTWLHWDAFDGGNAKWWMTGTGQALHTWDYFVEQYPDAIVLAYGFNQGTSNAETYAIVQNLEFDCATTTFGSGNVNGDEDDNEIETPPTNTGGGQGGGNVLGDSTGKVTPQVLGASTQLPATIPATGNASNPFIILVASLAAYGAAYFAQGRRNLGRKASLDL